MGAITTQLVKEAKKAGVRHIVKLSAMGADAEAGIPPQVGTVKRKRLLKNQGFPLLSCDPIHSCVILFFSYNAEDRYHYEEHPRTDLENYRYWEECGCDPRDDGSDR